MKNYIRSFLLIVIFAGTVKANTTTTRGGSLTTYLSNSACSINARLLLTGMPATLDSALVEWGDGGQQLIPLMGWPVTNLNGYYLVTIAVVSHMYSPGSYTLSFTCGKRVPWIQNVPNSDTTLFRLQAFIVVDPNIASNYSPISDSVNPEVEMNLASANSISPLVMSGETDSLDWSLTIPSGAGAYVYPDVSGGGSFILHPDQNFYEWNPQIAGLYSACFSCEEWREFAPGNWALIGTTTCEVLIDAGQVAAVSSPESNVEVNVHPNPSSEIITFRFFDAHQSHSIIIYDQLGKEVWREETDDSSLTISVQEFANGIYFYCVTGENETSARGKFLVE